MAAKLFDRSIVSTEQALDFIGNILESSTEYSIIGKDLNGRILLWNEGARRIYGYEPEEVVGNANASILHVPEDIQAGRHIEILQAALRDGKWEGTLMRVRKSGARFTARVVITPRRDSEGKPIGFLLISKDISDEIRLINELRDRTAQLEEANKELEAFAYSISHDLRSPLRGVDGYIRMLQEDCAGQLDAEGNRLLGVVSSEAKRMGRLIDDLLAFSRLGRQQMINTTVDMTSLARVVFEILMKATPESAAHLELKSLPVARGDPAMLRQVFANLLGNAVKYSRKQATPIIEVGGSSSGSETTYYVKDNGVGFDMAYVGKLFVVFQRLHSDEEFEGTGVGLALVRRIVLRHGGKVWAEGKLGEGATFYFTLPNSKEANA